MTWVALIFFELASGTSAHAATGNLEVPVGIFDRCLQRLAQLTDSSRPVSPGVSAEKAVLDDWLRERGVSSAARQQILERLNTKPSNPTRSLDDEANRLAQSYRGMGGTPVVVNTDEAYAMLGPERAARARSAFEAKEIDGQQLMMLTVNPALFDELLALYRAANLKLAPEERRRKGGHWVTLRVLKKILSGEFKPEKKKEVRGAHSASILREPWDYWILEQTENRNGTISVKFKKRIWDESDDYTATWSKPKKSTLAPKDWSQWDIEMAPQLVLMRPDSTRQETREDGVHTFVKGRVSGIEWELVIGPNEEITSSYPTGN